MLLFAGHDPGAKNHIWPIYQRALIDGYQADLLDLMNRVDLLEDDSAAEFIIGYRPTLLVTGSSMNQAERPLVFACKALGIPTIAVVDLSSKGKLDGWPLDTMPDRILVTNDGCVTELMDMGLDPHSVVLAGSAHLEYLAKNPVVEQRDTINRHYGLEIDNEILPFFCVPVCDYAVDAVDSLGAVLPSTRLDSASVIVRPHPRMPEKSRLEEACTRFDSFIYDDGETISNSDLLSSSLLSLSMASTVSLESLVRGVPSAFYQIGWQYDYHDDLYSNIEGVLRIRDASDLTKFIDQSAHRRDYIGESDVESCWGALDRSWKVVQAIMPM